MSDEAVRSALRSNAPLVVIEAPAGCGKTYQGADYARSLAGTDGAGRLLILTHTHAACSVFAGQTKGIAARVEIRTIDSLIASIAGAYHAGIGLPPDTAAWARQNKEGYAHVALKVAGLLKRHPMIGAALAQRYPFVICDEHQDCSGDQHATTVALLSAGSKLRIFADPMQRIYKDNALIGASPPCDWDALTKEANAFAQLGTPHRWRDGCRDLGRWTLTAREALTTGGRVDLRSGLPDSVEVIVAENRAPRYGDYQLATAERRPIDNFVTAQNSLLVLTHHNEMARALRGFFGRRVTLWEGHVRDGLETLVDALIAGQGNATALSSAVVRFMDDIGKGFSPSAFGHRFEQEARDGCTAKCRGKPAAIQQLARFLVDEPDHRGVAKMLTHLAVLKVSDAAFADIEMDCLREFQDAVRLGEFATVEEGLAEITHRRTYARPRPPARAISTIHKAKGLECDSVIVMPIDAKTFPDRAELRCLLYVALSRAKKRLTLVVSKDKPSPLLIM